MADPDEHLDSPHDAAWSAQLVPDLSAREREVLRTWLLSVSKDEVAKRLYISVGTVNTHLHRIRAKYELGGRKASTKSSLLARALRDGIIRLNEL